MIGNSPVMMAATVVIFGRRRHRPLTPWQCSLSRRYKLEDTVFPMDLLPVQPHPVELKRSYDESLDRTRDFVWAVLFLQNQRLLTKAGKEMRGGMANLRSQGEFEREARVQTHTIRGRQNTNQAAELNPVGLRISTAHFRLTIESEDQGRRG
jgi:hypothetical protein